MKSLKQLMRRGNKIANYNIQWFMNPARWRQRPTLPTMLNFPITDNCNSRCVMCDVWKTKSVNELSSADWRRVLRDQLFKQIQHVGISGGEPTLRTDLVEVVQAIIDSLPKLKSLSITSHGFHVKRWEEALPQIIDRCQARQVLFRLNLSVDGVGEVHDEVRGIPGGFDRTMRTLKLAKAMGVEVELQSTISSANVYNTGQILGLAQEVDSRVVFRQATAIARLENQASVAAVELTPNEKSYFADFLLSDQVQANLPNPQRGLFYKNLARQITTDGKRRAPCYFQNEGLLLTAHGDMYHCSISTEKIGNLFEASPYQLYFSAKSQAIRERLLQHKCSVCIHDQTGAWSPTELIGYALEKHKIVKQLRLGLDALMIVLRNLWLMLKLAKAKVLPKPQRPARPAGQAVTALLIGAYGGEHVGDAAILGGVLLRIFKQYQIQSASIASTRPDRTQRWVDELDVPVAIKVIDYTEASTKAALQHADYLVFAGGPIMDLPVLLSKHLQVATAAFAQGIPFVIEGVGIGPFRLFLSKWTAAMLLKLATTISVRTSDASKSAMVQGSAPALGRDPAFDYLETREQLTKLSQREIASIEKVLQQTEEKLIVGVNLRPLWYKYSALSKHELQQVESNFLTEFAAALTQFAEQHEQPICYLFFPMNPDQYGFSDLLIGYQLANRLPSQIDFRIWEIEPGIDAVIYMLRRFDLAITMRFHASIFALSQEIPTIGIDYMHGKKGKVGELFGDLGLENRVVRIDQFDQVWLVNQLTQLADRALHRLTDSTPEVEGAKGSPQVELLA